MSDTAELIKIHADAQELKSPYLRALSTFLASETVQRLRDVHEAACRYFNAYESLAAYTQSLEPSQGWIEIISDDCCVILESRVRHQEFLVSAATRLHLDLNDFKLHEFSFKRAQQLVAHVHPKKAVALRESFESVGLPVAGFLSPWQQAISKGTDKVAEKASLDFAPDGTLLGARGLESSDAREVLLNNAKIDSATGMASGAVGGQHAKGVVDALRIAKEAPSKKSSFWSETVSELKKQPAKIVGGAIAAFLGAWLLFLGLPQMILPHSTTQLIPDSGVFTVGDAGIP